MEFSVFIAVSVDGFIADENGDIDWLMDAGEPDENEEFGFQEFFSSIDIMIMGRKTMDTVLSFDIEWPYNGKRVIVLSNTMKEVPLELKNKIEIYSGSIKDLAEALINQGYKKAYVDGGKTIQSFIQEGLIDEITITTVPVILGEGIPLFARNRRIMKLEHIKSAYLGGGFTASRYRILK